jgi:hypothetical protein
MRAYLICAIAPLALLSIAAIASSGCFPSLDNLAGDAGLSATNDASDDDVITNGGDDADAAPDVTLDAFTNVDAPIDAPTSIDAPQEDAPPSMPVSVTSFSGVPKVIITNNQTMFFVMGGDLLSLDLTVKGALLTVSTLREVSTAACDSNYVYPSTGANASDASIVRAPFDGGPTDELAAHIDTLSAQITIDSNNLYFGTKYGIYRAPIVPGSGSALVSSGSEVLAIAAVESALVVDANQAAGAVAYVSKSGSPSYTQVTNGPPLGPAQGYALANDSHGVAWCTQGGGAEYVDFDAAEKFTQILAPNFVAGTQANSVAMDDENFYVVLSGETNTAGSSGCSVATATGAIVRVSRADLTPHILVNGLVCPRHVVLTNNTLYFLQFNPSAGLAATLYSLAL